MPALSRENNSRSSKPDLLVAAGPRYAGGPWFRFGNTVASARIRRFAENPRAIIRSNVYSERFESSIFGVEGIIMASVNVDKMSLKELVDLEARVRKAIMNAKERERSDLKNKIASLAENAGFTVSELFGGGRGKGGKVAVKYRNKDNPSETWTGRGRQPKWLAARLSKGSKLSEFAL